MDRPNHNRARAVRRGRLYCNKCRQWKPKSDFAEDFGRTHGRKGTCKRCMNQTGVLRRLTDPDEAILLPMQRRWNEEDDNG
jgi:hypothetical protein